jgi:hypothetical protein
MALSEGHYNEKLLPLLMAVAPLAGVDIAPFQQSMELIVRDKNQAQDNLDKVRWHPSVHQDSEHPGRGEAAQVEQTGTQMYRCPHAKHGLSLCD